MSEFFLELFSEEIPSKLQQVTKEEILNNFKNIFEDKKIFYKKCSSYSTPNRLIILFSNISVEISEPEQEIRGPKINAPENALQGFLKSNNIDMKQIYKKNTEKGEFYYFKKNKTKIKTIDFLKDKIPEILGNTKWKKSMRWNDYNLNWARPLKSILAVFSGQVIQFNFFHLKSSNKTFIDKEFEEKTKKFLDYKSYKFFFKKSGMIIENEERKKLIEKKIKEASMKKNIYVDLDEKLLDEVNNLVESPSILLCKFDKKFLHIPEEILVIVMQFHQKYFHSFDKNKKINNEFFVVANNKDQKGLIKYGNEKVIEARLRDAEFFWNKNKSQNLVKQVSKLKNVNYFKNLGNYYDKSQRLKKLSGLISDELLISKEKIEIASTICKVDLLSDLVGEFPELQGVLGGHFAAFQGFDKEICHAVSEHYLPTGANSKIPKKSYSIALSLADKLDTLVGFFGVGLKPSSSKDPYALRRLANGMIKIILENNIKLKLSNLIKDAFMIYEDQNINFDIKKTQNELLEFLHDRFKQFMKDKGVRNDIIDSSISIYNIDEILKIYKKATTFNKVVSKETGIDLMFSYKRALNIIESESSKVEFDELNTVDPGLFKSNFEKNLYEKIYEIKKDFSNLTKENENFNLLQSLASSKKEIIDFFDNVVVNDSDEVIKKNRLELLQMLCKTFNNYLNFSKVESVK